jgi:hypothetical protein
MPSLRSKVRDEFPQGWWRSGGWWLAGIRELGLNCLTAIAAWLFIREARHLVRGRDSPRDLADGRISLEGWTAGLLVGLAGLGSMVALVTQDSALAQGHLLALFSMGILWFLVNVVVSLSALAVIARSRIRHRETWDELDFIEANLPKNGRPPETVEEYRAHHLKARR